MPDAARALSLGRYRKWWYKGVVERYGASLAAMSLATTPSGAAGRPRLPTIDEMVTAIYNTDKVAFMCLNSSPGPGGRVYLKLDGDNWRFVPKVAAMRVFLDAVRRCPELDESYIRVAFRKMCTKVFDALMEKHCSTLTKIPGRGYKQGYVVPDPSQLLPLSAIRWASGMLL